MSQFKHLTVKGFRRLRDVEVPLRPLTVLLGVNGVGKSSVLDALSLLSDSAAGRLRERLTALGGLASVLTIDQASGLTLGTRMDVPGQPPLEYLLSLSPQGTAYSITDESLVQRHPGHQQPFKHIEAHASDVRYYEPDERRITRPTWALDPLESALAQVPKMFQQPEQMRATLASAARYHALDVGPRAPVRLPQTMQPADLPGANGETLVSCLYALRETRPERYGAIEDALSAAFPGFQGLGFPPVAAGTLAMTWRERAFSRPLYTHELSEGTLRFLWLATLLQSPALPAICMIDEPEVSLHPELLSLLTDLLREAAGRALVLVATHSDRLVRFLKPAEVLVMDVGEDGAASLTWADDLDLDDWLAEYGLEEVWRIGRLGGR